MDNSSATDATIETTPDAIEAAVLAALTPAPVGSALSPEAREIAEAMEPVAEVRKPNISMLHRAVEEVDGELLPLFAVGDRIVIERHAHSLPGNPWLDTQTYVVQDIDDETGVLRLWNPGQNQFAMGNYITGPERGDDYRLAGDRRNPIGKRKRGRPRKNPVEPIAPLVDGQPLPVKRGRGRPKGVKNRPKDVIAAERAARRTKRSKGNG